MIDKIRLQGGHESLHRHTVLTVGMGTFTPDLGIRLRFVCLSQASGCRAFLEFCVRFLSDPVPWKRCV